MGVCSIVCESSDLMISILGFVIAAMPSYTRCWMSHVILKHSASVSQSTESHILDTIT